MTVDMTTRIGALTMKNPVTTASGTFAAGRQYNDFFDVALLGAVTTKGVSLTPWEGNDSPRIAETSSGMLNSIGLQNPGVAAFRQGDLAWLSQRGVPIIVNVSGHSAGEYAAVIEQLEDEPSVSAYEINISCPNVDNGGMTFGVDPAATMQVISSCRAATKRPLIAKLTPNITDITVAAKAAVEAGADALSLINTLLGMAIDARTRRPALARKVGGMSGPAVKPVALRMVYEVSHAVSVPIVGMGGICTATDAVEFMLAGASAVAVGTASFSKPRAALDVVEGIEAYCEANGFDAVSQLVGALEE